MSRCIRRGRGGGAGGLALAVLLLGCNTANKPESEAPAPSEEYEDLRIGDSDAPEGEAGEPTDAELAAKQAAAQKVLETVKDRDPEEEKKKLARSHAISAEAGAKLDKGQLQDAVATARQALKVHEQNVDAMLVLAHVYFKEGKYELVRAVTSSALQIDPEVRTPEETSRAYNLQGFAMAAMGEDTLATQSFKKAAEVDENNAVAWNNLGTRYLDAGDAGTALSCFEYALQLDPRFARAHLNHGAALRAGGQWEAAEAAMRKALELRPNFAEAYFNLGVLYLDADPFPGLDTTQRLNKSILNLSKYRELAMDDGRVRLGQVAPRFAGSNPPPPRVSKDRADDFIRVANKGLEREQRRLDREKERAAKGAAEPTDDGTEATPADATEPSDDATGEGGAPQSPEPASPSEPSVQGPGAQGGEAGSEEPEPEPGEPEPSEPEPTQPAKPEPTQPAKPEPAKPAPQGPSTPTPTQPTPTPTQPTPTPTQPTPAPTQPTPTPTQPAPKSPTPVQPKPQGPGSTPTPQPPPAQKPSVQKPQSARVGPMAPKKISLDPASRGTRYATPTLNTMEAGGTALVVSSVDLASIPTDGAVLGSSSASTRLMVLALDPASTNPFV